MIYAHYSSSISNFHEKLRKRTGFKNYVFWKHWNRSVVFFGLYRPSDYLKFILHRGKKTVIWCGSDILQAGWWYRIIERIKAEHICENKLERDVLTLMLGKEVKVEPMFFGDPDKYPISFKPSKRPQVYLFAHSGHGAEIQAGLDILCRVAPNVPDVVFHVYGLEKPAIPPYCECSKNVLWHGVVPEDQLDEEIKNYQCHLRLHEFDGFSDGTAKSILNGGYPITRIQFPYIDSFKTEEELIKLLKKLKNKKYPNPYRKWWFDKLKNNFNYEPRS